MRYVFRIVKTSRMFYTFNGINNSSNQLKNVKSQFLKNRNFYSDKNPDFEFRIPDSR